MISGTAPVPSFVKQASRANDQDYAGSVSTKMLARYSHHRLEAKRAAVLSAFASVSAASIPGDLQRVTSQTTSKFRGKVINSETKSNNGRIGACGFEPQAPY